MKSEYYNELRDLAIELRKKHNIYTVFQELRRQVTYRSTAARRYVYIYFLKKWVDLKKFSITAEEKGCIISGGIGSVHYLVRRDEIRIPCKHTQGIWNHYYYIKIEPRKKVRERRKMIRELMTVMSKVA